MANASRMNGHGNQLAAGVAALSICASLIYFGIRIGTMQTQLEEIPRLRRAVEAIGENQQSLELYVRDLHMAR